MNNLSNSGSALEKFAEKIDFTNLTGKPEDFFKAGLAFVGNGQFDDGITEFVKIIKTVSHQDILFVNAEKELKSMGFSDTDIHAIAGIPKSEEEINTPSISTNEEIDTQNKPKSNSAGLIAYYLIVLLVFGFSCPTIIFGAAVTSNSTLYGAIFIFILLLIVPLFFTNGSRENKAAQLSKGETSDTQINTNSSLDSKQSNQNNQLDMLPILFIGGITLIIVILISFFR